MKKLFWTVIAVVLTIMTAGCVAPEAGDISITNTDGTTTEIFGDVENIVLLNSNAGEVLYLLGEADRVVGISKSIANNAGQVKLYPNSKIIGAWNEPDVEYLISMGADVVLAYSDSKPKNAEVLAAANIPVVYVDCTKPETMASDIMEIGKLVGKQEQAAEIAEYYNEVMDEVRSASMLASTHYTVYAESYTAWYGQGTDTGMGQLISWTFGQNIMKDAGAKKLSDEWVVTSSPEIIVKLVNNMDNADAVLNEIKNRRGFDSVSAVGNNKVWIIRNDLTYGPRSCAAAVALFKMEYPGIKFDLTPESVLLEFNKRFGTNFETDGITYPAI